MKRAGFILAAVSALALTSLVSAQPARADAGVTIAVVGAVGWGYCHMTYGQARKTPLCAWHDTWHQSWHAAPAKKK